MRAVRSAGLRGGGDEREGRRDQGRPAARHGHQRLAAEQILALVLSIANMWSQPGEDLLALVPEASRRQVIIDAVARLVQP